MIMLPSMVNCTNEATSRMCGSILSTINGISRPRRRPTAWNLAKRRAAGWWRTPKHKTPESLQLTTSPPPPMLGISGLLNLLTWVEHRQRAQASPHEEGGIPCPVSHPTRLPPTRFQPGNQSVGGSAPGQSSAASLAAESSARTPTGTRPHTKQGGRR